MVTNPYPSFFEDHLQQIVTAYQATEKSAVNPVGFIFITDVHIHLNGRASTPLILEISKRTGVDTVLCGGDHCWAFGSKAQCLADFKDSLTYMDPIRDSMNLFHARGNHDVTVRSSWTLETGYTMPFKQIQKSFTEHSSQPTSPVSEKLYYFSDDMKHQIRYIILDTSEYQEEEDTPWGVQIGMKPEQLRWLAQEALMLPDPRWAVVVMGHVPCAPVLNAYAPELDDLRLILEAFQAKATCSYGDFTHSPGALIAYLCGHNHKDQNAVHQGIVHISTGCDAYCKDDNLTREVGLPENTLFDLFLLDKASRTLHSFRVGAGTNRVFHY